MATSEEKIQRETSPANLEAKEKYRRERAVVRRLFTTTCNSLVNNLQTGDRPEYYLRAELAKLTSLNKRLESLNNEIKNIILGDRNFKEEELLKEEEEAIKYLSSYFHMYEKLEALFASKNTPIQKVEDPTQGQQFKLKLPPIHIKKFDGNLKNWLLFYDQFKKINDNENIPDEDKYHYLLEAMADNSEVKTLVESYQSSNYADCLQHLKSKYAREELLIQVYVREILALILGKSELSLTTLYDKLSAQLRALASLGVTKDKYAAFILPMIESALPEETLRPWERSTAHNSEMDVELNSLLDFIKKEVDSNQRILMAQSTFNSQETLNREEQFKASASCLVYTDKKKAVGKKINYYNACIWCGKDTHASLECYKMNKMNIEQRIEHLKEKRACTLCLKIGHHIRVCKAFIKCLICGKRHSTAICSTETATPKTNQEPLKNNEEEKKDVSGAPSTTLSSQAMSQGVTLLQTVVVNVTSGNKKIPVRAIFDNGSQRTYIKQEVVDKLKIPIVNKETLAHCLFGGMEINPMKHNVYQFKIEGLDGKFKLEVEALSQNCICNNVPKINCSDLNLRKVLEQNQIDLTDKGEKTDIELLIGADFSGYFMTGNLVQLQNGLVAIKTKVGWTLQGKQVSVVMNNTLSTTLFCSNNNNISDYWSLETLGIRDPIEVKSRVETEAEVIMSFEETIQVNSEGRYEVQLPWKVGFDHLHNNCNVAKQRLESATKKLLMSDTFDTYHNIIQEWHDTGIIESVFEPENNMDQSHYLPHRAVIKESSLTTKVRPVFDASARDKNGKSLNSCLEKGINFFEKIPTLLVAFRKGAIGISADIAKAFLQISISPKDRDRLRFLWWEDSSRTKMVTFRHCRVVFGLTPSPFLLSATIQHHLYQEMENDQQLATSQRKEAAKLLSKSYYVDNCITSLDSEEEVNNFKSHSIQIMRDAKFDLRQWVTSPMKLNKTGQSNISVLGIMWDTESDELYCNTSTLPPKQDIKYVTKREVLSLTQKIFDPIGYTSPVMLPPKLILKEAWRREISWDENLPSDLQDKFYDWYKSISFLDHCRVPRRLSTNSLKGSQVSLHLFCDASKDGYGACVLLRAEEKEKVTVQLVSAKSRITPPKQITIPRLELLAAVIGSRLLTQARLNLEIKSCQEYCWTDSGVALCWIKRELPWNTFVGNRVKEIRQNTNIENWKHIPGQHNWADLVSRGCNAKTLLECCWWAGPDWLLLPPERWPKSELTVDEKEVHLELKKTVCSTNITEGNILHKLQEYFSKYTKIVRSIAWMLRFGYNTRNKMHMKGELTYREYERAEKTIIRIIQKEESQFIQGNLKNLTQFVDENNLVRIQTKLLLSDFPECTKTPYLLTAKHPVVAIMVRQRHTQLQHAGANQLIADIRARFWIVGIRRLVKAVISHCIICKRHKTRKMQAPTAPLPPQRTSCEAVFHTTGVDLAGPLYLRNGEKCWVVLYTCAVYRAVHLELTRSLSTEAFIMTLRRFIARRGRINMMMSDQGTNFVGTRNLLTDLDWNEVQRVSTIQRITWKLNVPAAPWWGGYWERLIKIMKELLRRILGKKLVTYDELQTLLCECESIMNNRPLTYVQDDNAETLEPLTPACFLQPLSSSETTDLDLIDGKSLNNRMRYLQKLRHDFRERFKKEYLAALVQKHYGKNKKDVVRVGQVVLLETEEKRVNWPLGIVTKIFTGSDGVQRSIEIKTSTGLKIRPIQRLYPLEVCDSLRDFSSCCPGKEADPDVVNPASKIPSPEPIITKKATATRCGRITNLPSRYKV